MKYLIRSLKYFVALCVLCMIVMALNLATGFARLSLAETLQVMFSTPRGLLLPAVIVVLAVFYPKFGFIVRRIEGSTTENRDQIVNAFRTSGFSLRSEHEGVMTFRADGFMQRLMLLGEDEIKVYQSGDSIVIDGIRRAVARIAYRLDGYISMSRND